MDKTPDRATIDKMKTAYCEGATGLAVFKNIHDGDMRYLHIHGVDTGFTEELQNMMFEEVKEGFGLLASAHLYLAENRNLFIEEVKRDDAKIRSLF